MFVVPDQAQPLTQGDILDDCPLVGLSAEVPIIDLKAVPVNQWMARTIVLRQAC